MTKILIWANALKPFVFNKWFLLALVVFVGYFSHYFLGDDNPIEQFSEFIFDRVTGENIDFSQEDKLHP